MAERQAASPNTPSNNNTKTLRSADGEKFYEIARNGTQLNIRTGKTGTRGVVQVRTFESEEEAALVMEAYILEQIGTGYATEQ